MRTASITRKTKETEIEIQLNLDGNGIYQIETPAGFLNHMLELFSFHSGFDLKLKATGDIHVDYHHLIEDTGIVIGNCIDSALSDRRGIKRYGFASIPMDEALAQVSVDLGGRAFLVYNVPYKGFIKDFDIELFEEFFRALANSAKMTLHINVIYGKDLHHIVEAIFKAFAKALRESSFITGQELPSTKGII